jgi:hypothetical protein
MQRQKTFRRIQVGDDDFLGGSLLLTLQQEHSVSQFSRQSPTPFESSFDVPDQLNPSERMQRPKMFYRANKRRRFPRRFSSCHAMVLHQDRVSQFSWQPPSALESCFNFPDRYNTFNTDKAEKCSTARIGDSDFE